jgi:pimeloyl-ACP methyl ester carboxylesterase
VRKRRTAGIVGSAVGLAAAGIAAGVAVERVAVRRLRDRPDEFADEPFGLLPADEELTVSTVDGVDLHVETVGPPRAALTVVFAHGYCLDMGTWHFQRRGLADFADPQLRMVFYDQRGHGRSGRGEPGRYTIEQLGRDLDAVITAAAPTGPLVLVGHSMGGMSVMALAEQRPDLFADRVVGAGLISTSGGDLDAVSFGVPNAIGQVRKPLTPLLASAMRHRAAWLERARAAGGDLTWLLTRRYAFGSSDVSPTLVDYVEQMNGTTPIETVAGFLRTLSDHHRYDALRVLDGVETLVLYGSADLMTPPEHSRRLAELLPGCELAEIEGGGHLAVMQYGAAVNDHLRGFLSRAARAAAVAPPTARRRRA